MHSLSRLLLSGLVALSLTIAAVPAQASWSASIVDVMNLVYCMIGTQSCEGLEPGADLVDITTDNADAIAAAMPDCDFAAGQVWDGEACADGGLASSAESCIPGIVLATGVTAESLQPSYEEIQSIQEGWIDLCTLAQWQTPTDLECYWHDALQDVQCFAFARLLEAASVAYLLTTFLEWSETSGIPLPDATCFPQLNQNSVGGTCGDWTASNSLNQYAPYVSWPMGPTGDGLIVRGGDIEQTYTVTVPSSFTHVFMHAGGIGNTYNVHYNPETTTVVGSVGAIGNTQILHEDTSL